MNVKLDPSCPPGKIYMMPSEDRIKGAMDKAFKDHPPKDFDNSEALKAFWEWMAPRSGLIDIGEKEGKE
tara:strand:- start:11 stop:217 length:207 start_codon:yes stop_codon:yes gene_type:complete